MAKSPIFYPKYPKNRENTEAEATNRVGKLEELRDSLNSAELNIELKTSLTIYDLCYIFLISCRAQPLPRATECGIKPYFGVYVIELILELKQKCRFDSEIGASLNLREKEMTFLSAIANENNITSKNLSSIAGLSPSRGSRVISSLFDKGYITMTHDKADRRLINLSLTQKGSICVKGIEKERKLCEFDLLNGLSENERETVKKGLNILLKKL